MSRFKSLKEISLKKKIFICLLVIAIVVAIVFLVIKFGFPDADTTKPYTLAYEVGADSMSKSQIDSAFDFFDEKCADEQKADSIALRNINSFYMARLSINKTTNHNVDRLLFALGEVQDMNKLNKKIKTLEKLKENVDEAQSDVVAYCVNQVMPYKASTTEYSRISDYFSNFAKKYTNYLKSVRDFVDQLSLITTSSTTESIYSNQLTHFNTSLNNKRLSLCVDACEKKLINGEEAVINAPSFDLTVGAKTTMFELKNSAIKSFVESKNEAIQNIDVVNDFSWLDGWIQALGTDAEKTIYSELEEATYSSFKTFMQTYFTLEMADYPTPPTLPIDPSEPQEIYEGEVA